MGFNNQKHLRKSKTYTKIKDIFATCLRMDVKYQMVIKYVIKKIPKIFERGNWCAYQKYFSFFWTGV